MSYLFRVSTKISDVWSNKTPKPLYLIAEDKECAEKWANDNLVQGLKVSKVIKLAKQVGGHIFTAL